MDFIADDKEVMLFGKMRQALQGLSVPHDASRVVGIGQDEQTTLVITHLFEILEVHLIKDSLPIMGEGWGEGLLQRIPHHLPFVPSGCQVERVVDGWLHDHLLILLQEEVDDHADALHDARDVGQPLTLHLPLVVLFNPLLHRWPILLGLHRVAIQRVLQPLFQGIGDEGRRFPIHISHPQRQQITSSISFLKHLMLQIA